MSGLLPHGLSWSDSDRSVWKLGYCSEKCEEGDKKRDYRKPSDEVAHPVGAVAVTMNSDYISGCLTWTSYQP